MANLRDQIQQAVKLYNDKSDETDDQPVGLAQNAEGVAFQCGTCQYQQDGVCHNDNPKLNGKEVQPEWCCNLYDHDGMKHITD